MSLASKKTIRTLGYFLSPLEHGHHTAARWFEDKCYHNAFHFRKMKRVATAATMVLISYVPYAWLLLSPPRRLTGLNSQAGSQVEFLSTLYSAPRNKAFPL